MAHAQLPFDARIIDPLGPPDAIAKAVGDLDGDGVPDLLVAGRLGPVVAYPAPGYAPLPLAASLGDAAEGMLVADVDADGDADVVLSNGSILANPAPALDPLVDPWTVVPYGSGAGLDVVVGDLDGDLDLDLVRRDASGDLLRVYRQDPGGIWVEATTLTVPPGRGLALDDLDDDGAPDLVLGDRWLAGSGSAAGPWTELLFFAAPASESAFVVRVADVNADGRLDVATASAATPGAAGRVVWNEAPIDPRAEPFLERVVIDPSEAVHDSLQLLDFDEDGDLDFLTAVTSAALTETPRVSLYRNEGGGLAFAEQVLEAVGSHGLQAADLGDDGDLDAFGVDPADGIVRLWENLGPVKGDVVFSFLSTTNGDLELPNLGGSSQTASLILDVDLDGVNDFVICERTAAPSVVWYKRTPTGWIKHVIDDTVLEIEAGGHFTDIDGDGDLDIAEGGNAQTNEVWWWENPYPSFDPATPWVRRYIKNDGSDKHHDLIFADFDGDGADELIYWNKQPNSQLFFAEIPADPKNTEPWPAVQIFQAPFTDDRYEGLAAADVDLDGVVDLVAGGSWFKYVDPTTFVEEVVDAGQKFSRAAAGQLIPGGRPELVFVKGDSVPFAGIDGLGPLSWYEWDGAAWVEHELMITDHGHSLAIVDLNRDGHLDIFNAEMKLQGNDDAAVRIFYGDSKGNFRLDVVSEGIGNHESKVGDLDGDGDLDILGKPFQEGAPGVNIWINERVDPGILSLNLWERFSVDPAQPWLSVFALPGDMDGDGLTDIVAGGWWYRNPGGDYAQPWVRNTIGDPFNNVFLVRDFDNDGDLDLLGTEGRTQSPIHPGSVDMHWADNQGDGTFVIRDNIEPGITTAPEDAFPQGQVDAVFQAGGPLQIAISWNYGEFNESGIDMLTLPAPADRASQTWTLETIHPVSEGEELAKGDIDGDGDLDLFTGTGWIRNDGSTWTRFEVTDLIGNNTPYDDADRVSLADLDADGDLDAVIGLLYESSSIPTDLVWLEHPADPTQEWPLHVIDTGVWGGFAMDVADMDNDGDPDVVLGEHVGLTRLIIYENDGTGFGWTPNVIDPGGEGIDHHDGALTVDFDGDGDLDIVSLGWNNQNVWFFENRAITLEGIDDTLPPTRPTQLAAQPYSSQQIDLSWQRSTDDFFILRYDVYRDGALAGSSITTSYSDTGLSENSTYEYTVVAIDAGENESPPSAPVQATTPFFEGEPPTVPGAFAAVASTPIRVDLSWTASTDNRALIGYRLYRDGTVLAELAPGALAYSDLGLLPDSTHLYALTAYDAEGNESDPALASQGVTTPPPETGLWAAYGFEEPAGNAVFDTSGNQNDGTLENGAVRNASGRFGQALETFGGAGNTSLGNLDIYSDGLTIMLWLNADDFDTADGRLISKSDSSKSQDHLWMLSTIGDATGLHLRARLRAGGSPNTLVGSGGTLTAGVWTHAAMTYDGATLRLFQDGVEVGSMPVTGAVDTDPDVLAWIGANPGRVKQVFDGRIDELKIFGTALDANAIQAEADLPVPGLQDSGPPTVPTDLQALPVAANRVDLTWTASSDDIQVVGYRVYRDGALAGTSPVPGFSDTALTAETIYAYEVSAVDAVPNESARTPVVYTLTPAVDTAPPSTSPLQGRAEIGRVELSWGAAWDDVALAGYRLFRDGLEIASFGPAADAYTDSDVEGGQQYAYALTAFDATGNESDPLANTLLLTTPLPTSSMYLFHRFEEGSGDAVLDLSGFGNDGTLADGATRAPAGLFGEAVEATGSNGRVELGPLDVEATDALTIMLWLNADDFGTDDARLLSKSTGSAADEHVFMLSTIGGPHLRARLRSGGTTTTVIGDGATLAPGQWIHAAMTYDGTALRLYQDGVEVGSAPMSGPIDLAPTVETWLLANPGDPNQVFDGRIDELKFFSAALSPAEIELERFSTTLPQEGAPPVPVPALPGTGLALGALALLAAARRRLARHPRSA